MDSIINTISSLVSSSKDNKLNRKLLSLQNKVKKIQLQERKKNENEKEDLKRRKQSDQILRSHFKSHWKSNKNANKILEDMNHVELRNDKSHVKKYRIKNIPIQKTVEKFLKKVKKKVLKMLEKIPSSRNRYYLRITLQKGEIETGKKRPKIVITDFHIRSPILSTQNEEERVSQFDSLTEHFLEEIDIIEQKESGWLLKSIDWLDIEQYVN